MGTSAARIRCRCTAKSEARHPAVLDGDKRAAAPAGGGERDATGSCGGTVAAGALLFLYAEGNAALDSSPLVCASGLFS